MRLLPASLLVAVTALLLLAAPVLAHDGGEGLIGKTDDKIVTNAGFILIAAFPLFILLVSLLQWRLEKRKDEHKAAAKARIGRAEWRGGW